MDLYHHPKGQIQDIDKFYSLNILEYLATLKNADLYLHCSCTQSHFVNAFAPITALMPPYDTTVTRKKSPSQSIKNTAFLKQIPSNIILKTVSRGVDKLDLTLNILNSRHLKLTLAALIPFYGTIGSAA